jgi:hypothetical protein
MFSTEALGGFHIASNGHTPKWPMGRESWGTCAGLGAGSGEKKIRVKFLLWGGMGRTMYFSNKMQNENTVFLHKGDLKCG